MDTVFFQMFIFIAIVFGVVDCYYAWKSFKRQDRLGRALGWTALFAGFITAAYLVSVSTSDQRLMAAFSGLYFSSVDCMLVSLILYVSLITRLDGRDWHWRALTAFRMLCVADILVMLINIPTGIAVQYAPADPIGVSYIMKPLYYVHLILCYAMIAFAAGTLIYKALHTSRQYRSQYIYLLATIVAVVAINAVYLLPASDSVFTKLDVSILGYSLGLYLMHWVAFEYRENDLRRYLSTLVVQNSTRGVVLFDDQDLLVMKNASVNRLMPAIHLEDDMTLAEFLDECDITPRREDHFSVQCDIRESPLLRCDFTRLRDQRSNNIGSLFIFSDMASSADINTGFDYLQQFTKRVRDNPYVYNRAAALAIFDITGLREVNRVQGREEGDRRIRDLSQLLRRFMPSDAVLLRGHEANLVAWCPGANEEDMRRYAGRVVNAASFEVLFGLCAVTEDGIDVLSALQTAYRSVKTKKLMTPHSTRSQALTSLVRALEEADSDTEAHVQRTQKMGELLGKRIGLTDAQLADLELLCLLHDIGKIGIPLEILNKPGRLAAEEWAVLQTHPDKGYQIAMSSNELKGIAEMILCHHERWDGNGYPLKLKGDEIPLLSRFIAIVDAYDAMVNDRAYRKALTPEAAQAEIRRCAGTQFDPALAEEFLQMLEEHPELAKGEKVGGGEIRLSANLEIVPVTSGNTAPIVYTRYILDIDDMIIEVDDQFEQITGYSAGEAVNKMRQIELIPADDRSYYLVQVSNQFSHGSIAYLKHEILRKDETRITVACCGKRFYDSAAKVYRNEIIIFQLT